MGKSPATKIASNTAGVRHTSIWASFDQKKLPTSPTSPTHKSHFRWVIDAVVPITLITVAGVSILLPGSLSVSARWSLFAFALCTILWSTTSLKADFVALAAIILLLVTGSIPQHTLYKEALSSDVIWLMIGMYIVGGAVQHSGLITRLIQLFATRAHRVSSMMWLMTTILIPLSFFIPSTSGRAVMVMPLFRTIADATNDDRRIIRAIAILMPSVILVSTITTLIGAGSHLVANDLLREIAKTQISFAQWLLYAVPFAIVSSYATCWVVMRLFLDKKRLQSRLEMPKIKNRALSRAELTTLIVVAVMVTLWITEGWHGFKIANVTVLGALILTAPGIEVLNWKEGLKAISWNLIIFVGAALVLGRSLIETGAAQWIIDKLFVISGINHAKSHLLILLMLTLISLTSHFYMTSHTARAVALVPPILYLAISLNLNPTAVLFISTVGMDYCLTFPVSSKALLMFQEFNGETYKGADLLRLSSVMLLVHLGLIVIFYYGYWRPIGLAF